MKHLFPSVYCIILMLTPVLIGCESKPNRITQEREQKRLRDSIDLINQQRTSIYTDSLLQTLLPKLDSALQCFHFEQNEQYESHGRYTYPTLLSSRNNARCFLQAQVNDQGVVTVKSWYYGSKNIDHSQIRLVADSVFTEFGGSRYAFESEGKYEIVTFKTEESMQILRFIDSYANHRIKVTLHGANTYSYYLDEQRKNALVATLRLALMMDDVKRFEKQQRQAGLRIERYINKQQHLTN